MNQFESAAKPLDDSVAPPHSLPWLYASRTPLPQERPLFRQGLAAWAARLGREALRRPFVTSATDHAESCTVGMYTQLHALWIRHGHPAEGSKRQPESVCRPGLCSPLKMVGW